MKIFQISKALKKSEFEGCIIKGLNLEFQYYRSQAKFVKALSILNTIDNILKTSSCKEYFAFEVNYHKALYYHAINDLENLSDFAFKALNESEKQNDDEKQVLAIQEVVYLFTRMNEDVKNWLYIKRAEKLILNLKNEENLVRYYRWLAFEYENKYTLTERKTLLDSCLMFGNKAKKLAFKYNMYDEITKVYRVQEACAYHRGDLKKALVYIDSSIYYAKKIKGHKNLSSLYLSKAWDHLGLGQNNEAIKWMDTALAANTSISAARMMMYSEASQIYQGAGNVDKAFATYKMYTKLKDSILNLETIGKVNELEQKYNKVRNEQKIFELKKTKQRYLFLIVLSLLAILTIVFFFRQRSLKNKQKIMETEQRLNRARINPHFFFNGMASLQNLSLIEKSPKTTLFISRFAKIMRQSLESTYEELTTVEEEVDFLTQYLEIQKLRYPEKFDYAFHIDNNLEVNELQIPGMLLQPFIENAIEHGFKDIDYTGKIDITFQTDNTNLIAIVEDNGRGLNPSENTKQHNSRAMQIVKTRLELFNKQNNSKAFYKLIEPIDGRGLKIIVTLPKIYV
ncbi:MAG: histidine kinase [Flavobacteriaceae bacterium]|nr:histidine kinase [Flavobacteriaceae bacterium]